MMCSLPLSSSRGQRSFAHFQHPSSHLRVLAYNLVEIPLHPSNSNAMKGRLGPLHLEISISLRMSWDFPQHVRWNLTAMRAEFWYALQRGAFLPHHSFVTPARLPVSG